MRRIIRMYSYLKKIDSFVSALDVETLSALNSAKSLKEFRKGEFLLRQDEICRNSFYVKSGLARKYYLTLDGKEITTELYFADDIAISFQSYTLQEPSREFIEALTDTTVEITDYETFQKLKKQFPKLLNLDLMLTEFYAMWLEERLSQIHTLSATDRYLKLLGEHPQLIQNIQLTHIASYLGITLETLSRIRAKISKTTDSLT